MFEHLTIMSRLIGVLSLLSVLLVVIGVQGVLGMRATNAGLETVYNDRLVPTGQLAHINDMMQESMRQLHLSAMHDPRLPESKLHDHPITKHLDVVKKNIAEVNDIWKAYMSTYLTP
ncbi:MAG: Tar ligand binding domain-containing protein, partial [Candidatus Thiodiazotropha sp.]